jgi:hypothetical protein
VIAVKRAAGASKSYGKTLVVCDDDIPVYQGMRKQFEKKFLFLAGAALIVLVGYSFFFNICPGIIFALFLLSFSLFYYVPGLEDEEP